jgi:beta-galactosidase
MRAQSWSTDFEDVGGAVNIYGLDSYPNGFNCANPSGGFNIVKTYYQWFQNYSFTQPEYMPEYQGALFSHPYALRQLT